VSPALHLDTSALVKLYVQEAGTEALVAAARSRALRALSIARVEAGAAIWRRHRAGDLAESVADDLVRRVDRDCRRVITLVPVTDDVLDEALRLCRRHGLRADDAMQLAGALRSTGPRVADDQSVFVASDDALLAAARTEGLRSWNPATTAAPP
jgi:uncharacterized protein